CEHRAAPAEAEDRADDAEDEVDEERTRIAGREVVDRAEDREVEHVAADAEARGEAGRTEQRPDEEADGVERVRAEQPPGEAREAQIVVVGWQVYAQTGDPLTLGLIGLAEALPFIGVALYAGHLADRVTRRTIAIAGTFGIFLSAVALLLFTLGGFTQVWPIYVVIFLSGIARSFTRPAVTA